MSARDAGLEIAQPQYRPVGPRNSMTSIRSTPRRHTNEAEPTIIHVSGHTRPKRTPRRPARSASKHVAKESKTPTGRRGRHASKLESDDEELPTSVATFRLGEDEEMDDANRSSTTESPDSEEDSEEEVDEPMTDGFSSPTKTPVARKTNAASTKRPLGDDDPPPLESFVNQTAFDLYFSHANRKSHVSKHVLSALVESLSKDEYKTLIARSAGANRHMREIERLNAEHSKWFGQYALELAQGFNLCFYGTAPNAGSSAPSRGKVRDKGVRRRIERVRPLAACAGCPAHDRAGARVGRRAPHGAGRGHRGADEEDIRVFLRLALRAALPRARHRRARPARAPRRVRRFWEALQRI